MRWWHGYAVVIAVSLLLALGLALTGCANSLPLGQPWVECDPTYPQPVWTGTRWVECI